MRSRDAQTSKHLNTALNFVNQRIEAEAKVSGEPLSDHERGVFRHLPTDSLIPMWPDPESPTIIPRDLPSERLCSIAKASYSADLGVSPEQAADWEFAAAVSKLHRHPIAWLLQNWAGVRVRRPCWDRWLLVLAAVVVVVVGLTCGVLADGQPRTSAKFIGAVSVAVAVFLAIYFSSRHMERWQLKQTIENCRRAGRDKSQSNS